MILTTGELPLLEALLVMAERGPNIIAILQKVRGKRVSERVAACRLTHFSPADSFLHGFL
jgi:hypothetical protein